jgi:predicted ABC-type ATPase
MPRVLVIGGPNGAGKTTAAPKLMPEFIRTHEFVNADQIARGISPLKPENVAIEAGRLMLKRIDELARAQQDFALEATLSARSLAPRLKRLQSEGYQVHLFYLWVRDPELAVARVQLRAQAGGHSILEPVIRRRYVRSIDNFLNVYSRLADWWEIHDNSMGTPVLVASGAKEGRTAVADAAKWAAIQDMREEAKAKSLYGEALRIAVAEAIEEHRRMRRPIAIWRDGKVVKIPPEEIEPLNPDKPMRSSLL